ncbi:MAG: extracellular solute-binding protein [Chloroflexi bacterium]|nr:extracellular solute-binding protein [Chloroflexota bacterium]
MNKHFYVTLSLVLILLMGAVVNAQDAVTISFATWGNSAEIDGFNKMIADFEQQNPNVTVTLLERPSQGYGDQIVTEMAAGQAPDVIRAGFVGDFAKYAASGGTIDLTPYLEPGFSDDFLPSAWTIVSYEGKPYGLPLATDTFGLFYNVDYFKQAGIEVPKSADECWSWDKFLEVSQEIKDKTDADYGHAALWNGKRWLMILYGNGGQLLNDDLTAPAINSPEGIGAIAWTKSWYDKGLSPLSTSLKPSEQATDLFLNGTVGMLISGSWQMPYLKDNMVDYKWDVTYLPCSGAGQDDDLGGNGLAVTKDSAHPDIAAEFIKFATDTENVRPFDEAGYFIPVRLSAQEGVKYAEFNTQMQLFNEFAKMVSPHHAAVQGMSLFPRMNAILQDELDLAFVGGQSAEDTAQHISDKIADVLANP